MITDDLRDAGHHDLAAALEAATFPWHMGATADDAAGDLYRALVSLKTAIDRFDEIPREFQPIYRDIGKALGAAVKARQATTQVRETLKRLHRT